MINERRTGGGPRLNKSESRCGAGEGGYQESEVAVMRNKGEKSLGCVCGREGTRARPVKRGAERKGAE